MTQLAEQPILENDSADGWPVSCDLKIINPGVVHYDDLRDGSGQIFSGEILADKDFLDKIAPTLKGRPIINWDHKSVSPRDFDKGAAQGIITGAATFSPQDGYYHAEALVWNKATLNNIKKGFSISCAYKVSAWRGAGSHNKVPYENAADDGEYTHVAVVSVPRYEGARIELLNSINGEKKMGLMSFFSKEKPDEKIEVDAKSVMIDGVPLEELQNSYVKIKAAETKFDDAHIFDVHGEKVSLLELKNAHKKVLENSMKDDHEDGEHKDKSLDNCSMCKNSDDEEEKKKEEEKKNSDDDDEKKKKADEERKNSVAAAKSEAVNNGKVFDKARNTSVKLEFGKLKSLADRQAEGEARYGKK